LGPPLLKVLLVLVLVSVLVLVLLVINRFLVSSSNYTYLVRALTHAYGIITAVAGDSACSTISTAAGMR
jgi:hypothetical protein